LTRQGFEESFKEEKFYNKQTISMLQKELDSL